jgi:surfeit locus 1 family protein
VADTLLASKKRVGPAGIIGLVVAIAILLTLGTWQVFRLQWKEGLLAEIEARTKASPVSLSEIETRIGKGEDIDYVPMRVKGHFDHSHERHFLATSDGSPGFHIYTPLILADNRVLIVNRGFVHEQQKAPKTRLEGQVAGEVTITGLARSKLIAKPSFLVPENDVKANMFFWKDLDAMASSSNIDRAKLLPFFLDADATPNPGGWPKGGVTQIDLPNNHLSYAVTWYGLALALLVVSVLAIRGKAR